MSSDPTRPHGGTRRRVLALGTGGLLLALGARACVPWREVSLPADLVNLSAREARLFAVILPAMLPLEGTKLVPLERLDVLNNIDRQVGRLPRPARGLLAQALAALDYAAIACGGSGTRAANLGPEALAAYLEGWSRGGEVQRAATGAVKQIVALGYFGDPGAWGALGYDGPITGPRNVPRLGNQPPPEA